MILDNILKFSILISINNPISTSNIRNNYLKVLEVISSLNIIFYSPGNAGRKPEMTDIEAVALILPESTGKAIKSSLIFSENPGKELRHCSHNYATSS